MASETVHVLDELPPLARPADQVVASMTVHPSGLAKSYHPRDLLSSYNLRQVGSRRADIVPEKNSSPNNGVSETSELFIAGSLKDFRKFSSELSKGLPNLKQNKRTFVQYLETISNLDPLKNSDLSAEIETASAELPFETVLHIERGRYEEIVSAGFDTFATSVGVELPARRSFQVGGLKFVPIISGIDELKQLSKFSFLRHVRAMPKLRTVDAFSRSTPVPNSPIIPLPEATDEREKIRVAVFDGGLEDDSLLKPFATSHEPEGIGTPSKELTGHGFDVTSSLLFGSLQPGKVVEQPLFHVDHYRVLDLEANNDPFELYDVLDRIQTILQRDQPEYANLSLGPALPADDHEVHAWTAVLDEFVASTGALITVAAGNTGQRPWPESRVQVPGDSVNMLCVGSADSTRSDWAATDYSSVGPGRRPGVVKPDLCSFGGTLVEPFLVYNRSSPGRISSTAGTSFAAPALLRTAATIRAKFGESISPLAAKALIINSADSAPTRAREGWGRAESDIAAITECGDGTVRVLYQGKLSPKKSVRAKIPIPRRILEGNVEISATICYLSATDPEDPASYTRAGLDVTFRPNINKTELKKAHAKSDPFFKNENFASEADLRRASHKWETVMHATRIKRGKGLVQPCFDIHYIPRTGGGEAIEADEVEYAMVITVRAKNAPDLYEQVIRDFQGLLEEVRPVNQIQIQI